MTRFYEWKKTSHGKIPFYIHPKQDTDETKSAGWMLAALYDQAKVDGKDMDTYSLITTRANDIMSGVHDRMPVILELGSKELKQWLDVTPTNQECTEKDKKSKSKHDPKEWQTLIESIKPLLEPFKGSMVM